jgi:predicted lysophospholipase L1 biosynthesis ABC-type transport system permease subunit
MQESPSRAAAALRERLLAQLRVSRMYLISMAGLLVALVLLLGHSAYSEVVLVVCVLFAVIFFGVIALSLRLVRRSREEVPPFDVDQPSGGVFTTFTGPLRKGEAKVQLMIIPAVLAFGFLMLAVVDLLDRAHIL